MARLVEITGKAFSGEWGNDDEAGTGIPVLRTTNFTNDGIINYANVVTRIINTKNLYEKYLRIGDIIIEKSGGSDKQPVGRVVYFEGPVDTYLFNNFTAVLRIKDPSRWDSKYLFYALFSNYQKGGTRKYQNKTTGLHNLKTEQFLEETEIPERLLSVQKSIAEILDKVSSLISLRKQQFAKLDELVKARFVEMFGDPATNPKQWRLVPLLEMGDCKNGMNFHDGDSGITLHCLGVGDFKNLSKIHEVSVLSQVSLNELPSEEYLLKDGDIVFVRSNGNKALVGRCVAVYPGSIQTTFSGFCIRYRRKSDMLRTDYLLQVLKSDSMRQKMAGRGANIQNLNQQILSTLLIPVPPKEAQNEFADFVTCIEKTQLTIRQGLDKLEMLKKALMQEYFGGGVFA